VLEARSGSRSQGRSRGRAPTSRRARPSSSTTTSPSTASRPSSRAPTTRPRGYETLPRSSPPARSAAAHPSRQVSQDELSLESQPGSEGFVAEFPAARPQTPLRRRSSGASASLQPDPRATSGAHNGGAIARLLGAVSVCPGIRASPAEPTKKFEAPHRMGKETFFTTGRLTAVSLWRTSSWIVGHLPAGPTYRVGGWLAMIGYAASPTRRRWLRQTSDTCWAFRPRTRRRVVWPRRLSQLLRYLLELMRLPWLKKDEVDRMLEVDSLDRFSRYTRHQRRGSGRRPYRQQRGGRRRVRQARPPDQRRR